MWPGDRLLLTVPFNQFANEDCVLEVGDKLPRLTLLDDEGDSVSTYDLLGGNLVLWFYPKDDTSG